MITPEMKFSDKEAGWFWDLEQHPGVEVLVAGDSTSPSPKRMETLERMLARLEATKTKAENLLSNFIKEDGELELTSIDLAQSAERLECDFILRFIFLPASDPRKYDTYFDVCFSDQPYHPHEPSRLWPFKFVVGFY